MAAKTFTFAAKYLKEKEEKMKKQELSGVALVSPDTTGKSGHRDSLELYGYNRATVSFAPALKSISKKLTYPAEKVPKARCDRKKSRVHPDTSTSKYKSSKGPANKVVTPNRVSSGVMTRSQAAKARAAQAMLS